MKTKSEDYLEVLLQRTVDEIRAEYPDILDRMNTRFDLSLIQILRSKEEYYTAVLTDHALKSLGRGWVQLAGNGHAVDSHALPTILLSRVLLGSSPQSVLKNFRAFASDHCTEAVWYAAMAGVTLDEPITFNEEVGLIPWESVPDCQSKNRLLSDRDFGALGGIIATPNCAIRITLPKRRVFYENAMQIYAHKHTLDEISKCFELGSDIQRSITLSTGTQTGILISWTEATDYSASAFLGSAISIFPGVHDSGLFTASVMPASAKLEEMQAIFQKLMGLNNKEKAAMRTAIDRLNASWTWKSLTEQAIDLGIALEVLLLHDSGDDRGELRYRLSERGAKLLGGSGSEQLECFRKLKAIYDLRSKAVHVGSIADSEETREKLTDAKVLCARIAKEICKLGGFPNWERDYIFTTQSHSPETTAI